MCETQKVTKMNWLLKLLGINKLNVVKSLVKLGLLDEVTHLIMKNVKINERTRADLAKVFSPIPTPLINTMFDNLEEEIKKSIQEEIDNEGDGSYDFEAIIDGKDILVVNEIAIPFSYVTSGVALPIAGHKDTVGTPLAGIPLGTMVRVWSPKTNKSIEVPLVAVSPARKPKGSGGAIKLSSPVYTALGLAPGSITVNYRVLGSAKYYTEEAKPEPIPVSVTTTRDIALRALKEASKRIGVHEKGTSNWGPEVSNYLHSVGLDFAAPWCAAFIYYCFVKAITGLTTSLSFIPKSAYTPDWKNFAITKGKYISVSKAKAKPSLIKPGDLSLYYKSGLGRIGHIEIVERINSQGVWCIGGNTKSQDGNSVERNGGEVARNFRRWGSLGTQGGFFSLD